ncbi:MAG TPA: carbamoyltransferase HypF [Kofleriaceae bacterium]|nr:carbamoyltransferase HypF [Kofleriaceae bacterium]
MRIEIRGVVQGVGFRPWVYRVAHRIGVGGRVHNHAQGVTVHAFGSEDALAQLVETLRAPPPPARVRALVAEPIAGEDAHDFVIEDSEQGGARALSIPPDLATCRDCEREIFDPADRRFHYPFTNCTACGPRFTIATGVPYDRPATTMTPFAMCPACKREYLDPHDRRFHAQPNACPVCGPRLALWSPEGAPIGSPDPIYDVATMIANGSIVAIKGLGGFHLACDAASSPAVATLRRRKHRDEKPFAIMVPDLAHAARIVTPTDEELALLATPERPIVLIARRPFAPIAPEVAPDTDLLGVMLPYTPLHHLLLRAAGRPLVMTSANLSDEPICASNDEAVARLHTIADVLLVHDRAIATRCDDSVARVIDGAPCLMRRSRGFVPRPIALARAVDQPILAVGAQLKNTFCVAVGDTAYLGPHVGDLDNPSALAFFEEAVAKMEEILQVQPKVIAHDLHPGYLSTQFARARVAELHVGVQHHHAHVAAAIAEHGLAGPVIGVAYDGTGWGTDGTAWGGEVLFADARDFTRLATFRPIALAGGEAAIHQPWRVALALLDDAYGGLAPLDRLAVFADAPAGAIQVVRQMIANGLNTPRARGVGRFFDGIGALVLGRPHATYEGQLAVAWNRAAAPGDHGVYPFAITRDGGAVPEIDLRPMVRAIVDDLRAGLAPGVISARFHDTLVAATIDRIRDAITARGVMPIVLTGGAFQNPRLAEGVLRAAQGLDVRLHREVPPGDGGIALGQAWVADARARALH